MATFVSSIGQKFIVKLTRVEQLDLNDCFGLSSNGLETPVKSSNSRVNILICDVENYSADAHAKSSDVKVSPNIGDFQRFVSMTEFLLFLYRRLNAAKSSALNSKSFWNEEACVIAVQLCVCEANKSEPGRFETSVENILCYHEDLGQCKLDHLFPSGEASSNGSLQICGQDSELSHLLTKFGELLAAAAAIDLADILAALKRSRVSGEEENEALAEINVVLVASMPTDKIELLAVRLLGFAVDGHCDLNSTPQPASPFGSPTGPRPFGLSPNSSTPMAPRHLANSTPNQSVGSIGKSPRDAKSSAIEFHLCQTFLSHLILLVNARDVLALARVLMCSDLACFTALRKVASAKNLPMSQVAVSYVLRARLACNLAKPATDELAPHLKPLCSFVDTLHKMQTILEDVAEPRKCFDEVATVIRRSMFAAYPNCRDQLAKIFEAMKTRFEKMLDLSADSASHPLFESPPRAAGNGGSVVGRKFLKTLQLFIDSQSCQLQTKLSTSHAFMASFKSSPSASTQFPSLVSLFRSPEVAPVLTESATAKMEKKPKLREIDKNTPAAQVTDRLAGFLIYDDSPKSASSLLPVEVETDAISNSDCDKLPATAQRKPKLFNPIQAKAADKCVPPSNDSPPSGSVRSSAATSKTPKRSTVGLSMKRKLIGAEICEAKAEKLPKQTAAKAPKAAASKKTAAKKLPLNQPTLFSFFQKL